MFISRSLSLVAVLALVGCGNGGGQGSLDEASNSAAAAAAAAAAADKAAATVCTPGAPDPRACDPADTKKTTICHIPPGNPANEHTLCVGNPAVPAHLAHGDHLGSCCPPDDGGNVTGGGG